MVVVPVDASPDYFFAAAPEFLLLRPRRVLTRRRRIDAHDLNVVDERFALYNQGMVRQYVSRRKETYRGGE